MKTKVVAFDEAGNTGEDLLNTDQPVFTLASVLLSNKTASALATQQGSELHFKTARRSAKGRTAILRVLTDHELSAETVRAVAVHKPFSVVAKMVDLLVEPVAARAGYDFYSEGTHVGLSNLLFATLPVLLGEDTWLRIVDGFVAMCREPSNEKKATFVLSLGEVARRAQGSVEQTLRLFATGVALGEFGSSGISDLDPAAPSLMALAHAWAADGEAFAILHDDRAELARWGPHLAEFWRDREDSESFTLYDGRSITYPLPITELKTAASHSDARLQVADVVAGALHMVFGDAIGQCSDPKFSETLRNETPVASWLVDGCVWPSLDMDPIALGALPGATANLAEAMTAWTLRGLLDSEAPESPF